LLSAKREGHLGWSRSDQFVPAMARSVEKLESGDVEIVPELIDGSWYVVKCLGKRRFVPPSFDSAYFRLYRDLYRDRYESFQAFVLGPPQSVAISKKGYSPAVK
jgi:hypothetical protein